MQTGFTAKEETKIWSGDMRNLLRKFSIEAIKIRREILTKYQNNVSESNDTYDWNFAYLQLETKQRKEQFSVQKKMNEVI